MKLADLKPTWKENNQGDPWKFLRKKREKMGLTQPDVKTTYDAFIIESVWYKHLGIDRPMEE